MKIKLKDWAGRNFSPVPHRNTLVNWLKNGKIYPLPEFVGTAYFVDENAKYVGRQSLAPSRPDRKRLCDRINNEQTKR